MSIRASIQADTEEECIEGLARLVEAGFVPIMMPRLLTDNRWLARAVPTQKTPACEGRGPVAAG